jgi:hypothetical protein
VTCKIEILDVYFTCCGLKFRDRKELLDHQVFDLNLHRDSVVKQLRQHARMWAILNCHKKALEMRRRLDDKAMDWWR